MENYDDRNRFNYYILKSLLRMPFMQQFYRLDINHYIVRAMLGLVSVSSWSFILRLYINGFLSNVERTYTTLFFLKGNEVWSINQHCNTSSPTGRFESKTYQLEGLRMCHLDQGQLAMLYIKLLCLQSSIER